MAEIRLWRVERHTNADSAAESADSRRGTVSLTEVPHRRSDWVVFNDRRERWSGAIEVSGCPP